MELDRAACMQFYCCISGFATKDTFQCLSLLALLDQIVLFECVLLDLFT